MYTNRVCKAAVRDSISLIQVILVLNQDQKVEVKNWILHIYFYLQQ